MSSKPTVMLVGGAWHPPQAYWSLVYALSAAGFPVQTVALPSVNHAKPLDATLEEDIMAIRDKHLLPLIENGTEVILICHSYGGHPSAIAARGLSKASRQKGGKSGGIVHLVWMSAFMIPEGKHFGHMLEVDPPKENYILRDQPVEGHMLTTNARAMFFADVDPTIAAQIEAMLQPQAEPPTLTVVPAAPAWVEPEYDGRRTYLYLTEDAVMTPKVQRGMIENSGVKWNVVEMKSSHSVFASQPLEVVKVVEGLVG